MNRMESGTLQDFPLLLVEEPLAEQDQDVLHAFAWDEVVCRKVGEGLCPQLLRIWRHPHALVLGLRDRKLPYAGEAIRRLREQGVSVGVRNSGGAAVPLDPEVVNLSLILPYPPGERMNFHEEFRRMAKLIAGIARPWVPSVDAGEVRGSFCPGEYDLSVSGRKFCGIAQRRQLRACVVSAFVLVGGRGEDRGKRAQHFYREATGGLAHEDDPTVIPGIMASLMELGNLPSLEAFMDNVRQMCEKNGAKGNRLPPGIPDPAEVRDKMAELKVRYDHD